MRNVKKLTQLLQLINAGGDPGEVRSRNGAYLDGINAVDLAFAEKDFLYKGMTVRQLYKMSQGYSNLIGQSPYSLWKTLAPNHLARQTFVEHEVYRTIIYDLKDVALEMQKKEIMSDTSSEYRHMGTIIQRLLAAHDHSCYEEDILIPELIKFGLGKIGMIVKNEHKAISLAIENLAKLFNNFENMELDDFKDQIFKSANYVFDAMMLHCFLEDSIVLPMALDLLDASKWQRMKDLCNELGYCGMRESPIL